MRYRCTWLLTIFIRAGVLKIFAVVHKLCAISPIQSPEQGDLLFITAPFIKRSVSTRICGVDGSTLIRLILND